MTLTGPGGIGKTRLAPGGRRRGRPLPGRCLVGAACPAHGSPARAGDRGAGARCRAGTLLRAHRRPGAAPVARQLEQVVEAAPELRALLDRCPRLQLLVTSRESLRLEGEWTYAVDPLPVDEAVELFQLRADAVGADTEGSEAVEETASGLTACTAVELAAARAVALCRTDPRTTRAAAELLDHGARDAPTRQQTLRTTIDWSYDLLTEDENLRRPAVRLRRRLDGGRRRDDLRRRRRHAAGFDREKPRPAARRALRDAPDIREYAAERLRDSSEADELGRRHAEHFTALAENALPELFGRNATTWLALLEADLETSLRSRVRSRLRRRERVLAARRRDRSPLLVTARRPPRRA